MPELSHKVKVTKLRWSYFEHITRRQGALEKGNNAEK